MKILVYFPKLLTFTYNFYMSSKQSCENSHELKWILEYVFYILLIYYNVVKYKLLNLRNGRKCHIEI